MTDLEAILLKGHLLLEISLDRVLERNIEGCGNFSFYRKIKALRNITTNDENKLDIIISILNQLNRLRNKLAHEMLFDIKNGEFEEWANNVMRQMSGAKFTKYTYRTKIIHSFSVLSRNIVEIDDVK